MLKHFCLDDDEQSFMQPPSRGCVLKLLPTGLIVVGTYAAAFARLCVETHGGLGELVDKHPQPPSRGCVLKPRGRHKASGRFRRSRLRAAVC